MNKLHFLHKKGLAITRPTNAVACSNRAGSVHSLFSPVRCEPSCERLWLHWSTQHKAGCLGKWGWTKLPRLLPLHHPESGTLFWHTSGMLAVGLISPGHFWEQIRAQAPRSYLFQECLAAVATPTNEAASNLAFSRRSRSGAYAPKIHSIGPLNFWTLFVWCCHP